MSYSRLLIPALFLALTATAVAQDSKRGDHNGKRADRITSLDTNGDGEISSEEAKASQLERFAKVDANNDGTITQDEIQASAERRRTEARDNRFARIDTDGNGSLSEAEFLATDRGNDMFKRLDANNDGTVSAEELAARPEGRRGRRGQGRRRGQAPAAPTVSEAETGSGS